MTELQQQTIKQIKTLLKKQNPRYIFEKYNELEYKDRISAKGQLVWDMMLRASGSYSK
jgi:hypothetical protein